MSLATELIDVVDDLLTEFAETDNRTVTLRTVTKSGNYSRIGRSVQVSYTDTELSPKPVVKRLSPSEIAKLGNKNVLLDDWLVVLSVNAITREQLISKNSILVFTDSDGNEEAMRLTDFQDPAVNSTTVVFVAYFRSTNRQ